MSGIKISSLPPVKEYETILEYIGAKESGKLGYKVQYGDADLFQMIRILENQNNKLRLRVEKLENLVIPLG